MQKSPLRGVLVFATLLVFVLTAAAHDTATVYGLAIPSQVGGLTRGPPTDHESKSPGGGYGFRFSGREGWTVDVYIYDAQLKSIPADLASEVVADQFRQAQGDIVELGRRGVYGNLQTIDRFEFIREGKALFTCSGYNYLRGEKQGVDSDSYLCLTSWNNKFVKFRVTGAKGSITRAEAASFVSAWIPLLWPK